jgi:hypothetical protein
MWMQRPSDPCAGLRGIFELIHLMVERPTWNQKAFQRACTAIVSGSRAVQKSLERANHDRVLELVYGPDRRFREPTLEEVAQLTLEDVQRMVEKFLRPDNLEVRRWDQASTLPVLNVGIPALFARFSARHFRHCFR